MGSVDARRGNKRLTRKDTRAILMTAVLIRLPMMMKDENRVQPSVRFSPARCKFWVEMAGRSDHRSECSRRWGLLPVF